MRNTSSTNWAFDTNILVYLLDRKSPNHSLAVEAFKSAESQEKEIIIAQQNLVELIQVLTTWYGLSLRRAVAQAEKAADRNVTLITPLPHTFSTYLDLCKKSNKPKNHFDLYLAATLLNNDVPTLITNDPSGFKTVKELTVLSLAEFR